MEVDRARMRYLRVGSGPALILLHGLMGYAFSWRFTMPALAPYATVYAPDMLGAGFSDRPQGVDHSVRGTALRVLQFAEQLGLGSFDLLGTSRGGAVATAVAAECARPDGRGGPQVRRLILACPVNLYPYFHGRLYGDRNHIPPGSLEGYKAPLVVPGLFEHALSVARTWTADVRELKALLPTLLPIPTLLIWGSKDPAVYVSSMTELARHFPRVQTVVFPGVGHLPYEECPEEFNRVLIEFLTENSC